MHGFVKTDYASLGVLFASENCNMKRKAWLFLATCIRIGMLTWELVLVEREILLPAVRSTD